MWFLKIIIIIALVCFTALFIGGFLSAEPTEIVKKALFGGASAVMVLFAIGVIFADKQREGAKKIMINRTERIDEIFWTVIGFVVSAVLYFLMYVFFVNGKFAFGVMMLMGAFSGTFFTLFCIRAVLLRRWAEQGMREMQKENKENR